MRPIDADALKTHVCNMCDDGQRECKGDESCAILCWINDMPTIEADINRAAILRLCNDIEMIIGTVCDTGYTLQGGDVEAIMKRTKAIRKELTGDAGTD